MHSPEGVLRAVHSPEGVLRLALACKLPRRGVVFLAVFGGMCDSDETSRARASGMRRAKSRKLWRVRGFNYYPLLLSVTLLYVTEKGLKKFSYSGKNSGLMSFGDLVCVNSVAFALSLNVAPRRRTVREMLR